MLHSFWATLYMIHISSGMILAWGMKIHVHSSSSSSSIYCPARWCKIFLAVSQHIKHITNTYEYQGSSYGGGAGRGRPPLTISGQHQKKKKKKLVPCTMFHNWGSIITQYTCVIYIENDLVRLWIPAGALPPVVGAALRWLHSLRLPLLFTIIFHHSDWAS